MYFHRLRDLREDNDYSLLLVSDFIHCSKRTYQRYEKGDTEIPSSKAILLASLYNVSLDYLLGISSQKGYATRQICPAYRRLRLLRRKKHYSQEELANLLYYKKEVYRRYELGTQEIPIQMAIQLAFIYQVSVDYILGLQG